MALDRKALLSYVPLGALIASVLFGAVELRRKADGEQVRIIDARVEHLEHQLNESRHDLELCEIARTSLERERVQLFRQIAELAARKS